MPKILTEGKVFHPQLTALPGQQEQNPDVFAVLNQRHQEAIKNIETQFGQAQEQTLQDVKYKLQTLSNKYHQERSYIEGLRVPANQKRDKLLQLNNKYELAAITARSKVKPDLDKYNLEKQQQVMMLEQAHQQKQRDLKLVQQLVDDGVIKDPHIAKQKQFAMLGINLPASAFRELSLDEMIEQTAEISGKIGLLEESLKTATGKEREAIAAQILNLEKQRIELMGAQLPEHKAAIEKSNKLTKVGLQMQTGRKPGTLAEGVWQKKQRKMATFKGTGPSGYGFPISPFTKRKKEKEEKQPTPAGLRAKGTKEAYERGVELGYWN